MTYLLSSACGLPHTVSLWEAIADIGTNYVCDNFVFIFLETYHSWKILVDICDEE